MLSLILPTYNESENLPSLLEEIESALGDIPFEVVIVDDDSPDKTWEMAELLAKDHPYIRVIRRINERGLSSAVVEGFSLAKGDTLVVMDSDGQHDPILLPRLYAAIQEGASVAIGSRYIPGGSVEGWARARHFASFIATACAWMTCTHRVHDPMSGYFAISKTMFEDIKRKLRPRGFKILLEVLGMLPHSAYVQEIPLVFRLRKQGKSKLNAKVEMDFFIQIFSLLWRRNKWFLLFIVVSIVSIIILLPRVWGLRLLYLDTDMRQDVREHLEQLVEENGWILSDVSVRSVQKDGFQFIHRSHHRGNDEVTCFDYFFERNAIQSCF